jgi:hypothetical protein
VAELSRIGNDQHNPGKPLHWDRSKSGDELDAEMRHMIDGVTTELDTDGVLHKTKKAWRAMADLQKAIESRRKFTSQQKQDQYLNEVEERAREREARVDAAQSSGKEVAREHPPGEDGQPLPGWHGGLLVLGEEGRHVDRVEVGSSLREEAGSTGTVSLAGHLAEG